MADIIRTYRQSVPAARFIGKKYGDGDRVNGSFGARWRDWFAGGWFEDLEKLPGAGDKAFFEDSDAYIGLMRHKEGDPFEYWIGLFEPEGTAVPKGFGCVDFPAGELGVAWVRGPESDVYMKEALCAERISAGVGPIIPDENGVLWFFERYGCPRFTTPDEQGNIILDICFYLERESK